MNWSAYSRYVGNVFGGPLAMEGLVAFFLESTFLGIWIFGWDRLPKSVHLASIWLVSAGTALSAAFIMAANSWMQHPVGYTITQRAAPTEQHLGAVHEPDVPLGLHPRAARRADHGGRIDARRVGVADQARPQRRGVQARPPGDHRDGASATILAIAVGSELGVVEAKYQPMKIAAAEAQWETCNTVFVLAVPGWRRPG